MALNARLDSLSGAVEQTAEYLIPARRHDRCLLGGNPNEVVATVLERAVELDGTRTRRRPVWIGAGERSPWQR